MKNRGEPTPARDGIENDYLPHMNNHSQMQGPILVLRCIASSTSWMLSKGIITFHEVLRLMMWGSSVTPRRRSKLQQNAPEQRQLQTGLNQAWPSPVAFCFILIGLALLGGLFLLLGGIRMSSKKPRNIELSRRHPLYPALEDADAFCNERLKPCDDFYEYVCQNWSSRSSSLALSYYEEIQLSWEAVLEKSVLGSDIQRSQSMPYSIATLRKYYDSCMRLMDDSDALGNYVFRFLVAFNRTWPVLHAEPSDEGIIRVMVLLSLRFHFDMVVNIDMYLGEHGRPELHIAPGVALVNAFQPHFFRMHTERMLNWTNMYFRTKTLAEEFAEVNEVLRDIISRNGVELGAIRTPEVLTHLAPTITSEAWISIVQQYSPVSITSTSAQVTVHSVNTLRNIVHILMKPQYREMVTSYLLIYGLGEMLKYHIEDITYSSKNITLRSRRCLTQSKVYLQPIWNKFYVDAIEVSRALSQAAVIIHEVKLRIKEKLKQSEIFDAVSKDTALKKVSAAVFILPNKTKLKDVPEMGNNYLTNTLAASAYKQLSKLKKERRSLLTPQYNPTLVKGLHNTVIVPAAQLNRPLFYSTGTPYVNFATLGALAAHRLLQGLGEHEKGVDETNVLRNWWTIDTQIKMTQYVLCYRQLYLPQNTGGLQFSDADIWDQLISAVLGLRTAYELGEHNYPYYKTSPQFQTLKLTAKQLFFVRFCMNFCERQPASSTKKSTTVPGKWICNSASRFVEQFSDAFGCTDGSAMTAKETCAGF